MAKRQWKVEWLAEPKSDSLERLGQAVKLAIDHGIAAPRMRIKENDGQLRLALHASVVALEELDA
jgi:hypothetical protein